jgi:5-methylcytosine-specific restriction endonuclease McrBC regulatory subunit McrC
MQLVRAYANLPNWSVQVQPRLNVGVAEFQPDFVISKDGQAEVIFDAKWKHPRPEASDLHQVLAYGNVTGAKHVGLVYPGQRLVKRSVALPGRTNHLTLLQVAVPRVSS